MKFMIAVDLEGVACVVGEHKTKLTDSRLYKFACAQATKETNSAVKALYDNGAEEVIIWDNHGQSLNLDYQSLDKRCKIILGKGEEQRWPLLDDSYDGVLLIGYHSSGNTFAGVLSHSYSSADYQWIKINDKEIGEIGLDAAIAADKNVPVIFVASDDKAINEAKEILPWIKTVVTKKSLGRNLALSKHPNKVSEEIYDQVEKAVQNIEQMETVKLELPFKLRIRFTNMDIIERRLRKEKGWQMIDSFTLEKEVDSFKLKDLNLY